MTTQPCQLAPNFESLRLHLSGDCARRGCLNFALMVAVVYTGGAPFIYDVRQRSRSWFVQREKHRYFGSVPTGICCSLFFSQPFLPGTKDFLVPPG